MDSYEITCDVDKNNSSTVHHPLNDSEIASNDLFSITSTINTEPKLSMSSFNSELDDVQNMFDKKDDNKTKNQDNEHITSMNTSEIQEIQEVFQKDEEDTLHDKIERILQNDLTDGTKDEAEHTDDAEIKDCNQSCNEDPINVTKTSEVVKHPEESEPNSVACDIKTNTIALEVAKESKCKEVNIPDDKTKVNKKFDVQPNAGSVCDVCSKAVYPMEKLMMDFKCYHKSCLKCCKCSKTLNPTVATKFNNNIFCKPHYIELFRKRGRYDDINVETQNHDAGDVAAASAVTGDLTGTGVELDRVSTNEGNIGCGDAMPQEGRVAAVSKTWAEGRAGHSNGDSEEAAVAPSGVKVTNLKAMFESPQ